MIYNTKQELQGRILEGESRITAYNAFVGILETKLEKVNAGQPVTFRPESPITESSTKEEKVTYLEAAIKNNQDGIILEQQIITDCTTQLQKFPAE